jgi:hypothetical protein
MRVKTFIFVLLAFIWLLFQYFLPGADETTPRRLLYFGDGEMAKPQPISE